MPKTTCVCGKTRINDLCPRCDKGRQRRRNDIRDQRAKAYNQSAWRKLSHWQRSTFPLCAHCLAEGRYTVCAPGDRSGVSDHIIPFVDTADPKFLDPANLQTLCVEHHNTKTLQETNGVWKWTKRDLEARAKQLKENGHESPDENHLRDTDGCGWLD